MNSQKILVIDDEPDMLDMLSLNLKKAGYQVSTAENASQAFKKIQQETPSLILLDIMLPEMSGTEICKKLKSEKTYAKIPILILSAKGEEVDKVLGLELGAEDYVTKPFSPRELLLRIKNVLKRRFHEPGEAEVVTSGDLVVDRAQHVATYLGETLDLTPTEFKLLGLLMERRGRVQSRDRLLNDVWDYESTIDTRTVDTHIRRLREKLGQAAEYIETVRGVGYRFVDNAPQPAKL